MCQATGLNRRLINRINVENERPHFQPPDKFDGGLDSNNINFRSYHPVSRRRSNGKHSIDYHLKQTSQVHSSATIVQGMNPLFRTNKISVVATVILALITLPKITWGELPATQLNTIFPPGGKSDSELEVTVAGGDQDNLKRLFFSHPGITSKQKMTVGSEFEKPRSINNQFQVNIAADVPPGIYDVRVVGRFGVSNPRSFVVGHYGETLDNGENHQLSTAMEVATGKTINGVIDSNQYDYFKLTLEKGERVLMDCLAHRIDSRLDATLVVYNAKGKELVRNNDNISDDPFIDFTSPEEGEYIIQIHDFTYRGGSEYFYRLTVHQGPHLDFIDPPSGMPGTNRRYTVYGRNLPGGKPTDLKIDDVPIEKLTVNIALLGGQYSGQELLLSGYVRSNSSLLDAVEYHLDNSNPLPIYIAKAPVITEQEPNDKPSTAQKVDVPCEVVGKFYPGSDNDWIEFEAQKGESFFINVISHRLGLETDPYLRVQKVTQNDQGEQTVHDLQNADDTGNRDDGIRSNFDITTDDPSYTLNCDQDATYRVMVRDQYGTFRHDPRSIYCLTIQPVRPDFRMVVFPEAIHAPVNANLVKMGSASVRAGGVTYWDLRIDRRGGFNGEVEIIVEGLPPGVRSPEAFVGQNTSSVPLMFVADENAAAWAGTITVMGKSTIGGKVIERYARGGATVWGTANRPIEPPIFRVSRNISFAVQGQVPAPIHAQVGNGNLLETSRGGKLEVPITITRRGDYNVDLKLIAQRAPEVIKPADVTIKGDTNTGILAINITNAQAKPGIYTYFLRGDAKIKWNRNPERVAQAELEQKELEAQVKQLTEQLNQANAKKEAAIQFAEETTNAVKAAEEAKQNSTSQGEENQKAAEKSLAESQVKSEKAQEDKANAEQVATNLEAKVKAAQTAKGSADQRVEEAKKANAPADVDIAVISNPINIRIVETPLQISTNLSPNTLQPASNIEVPVTIQRQYGFAEKVDVSLEIPGGLTGIEADNFTIEKDQTAGKFQLTATEDVTPGTHTLTVRVKAKFNEIDVQASHQFVLEITPKEEEKSQP